MEKRLGDFGRVGKKVAEIPSNDGVNTYSIFRDNDTVSCDCIGYKVRKTCRHIEIYAHGIGMRICPTGWCHRLCEVEEIRSWGQCARCEHLDGDVQERDDKYREGEE